MTYLFLDLSTRSTGWCISDEKENLIEYGSIEIDKKIRVEERINMMKIAICDLIKKYDVKKVVAEEVLSVPNTDVYKKLTWLQGNVVTEIYNYNKFIDIEFITSSSWRSKIGINIGAGIKRDTLKKKDIEYVLNKYHIKANDDICDSICLKDAYFIIKNTKNIEEERKSAF